MFILKLLQDSIQLYMDASFPILQIETFEEDKACRAIEQAAGNKEIIEWNIRGLFYGNSEDCREGMALEEALGNFVSFARMDNEKFAQKYSLQKRVLVIKDAQDILEKKEVSAQLKYLAEQIVTGTLETTIIIVSNYAIIPKNLEHYITVLPPDYLSYDDIKNIILDFYKDQELKRPLDGFLRELALAFKGLPEFEINNILALALASNGEIGRADLQLIHEQKRQLVKKSGIMEMVTVRERLDDIGGLDKLKEWLETKAKILKNIDKAQEYGVDAPKGVLIAGLPGCGKSLCAKAAAALFEVPLLRMDMGRLMGKYVGESEANMRKAIALTEAIAPCVLWIDELEKAFAGIGSSGGSEVTTRLFGTFLTWMQEKNGLAFVVATANKIQGLPPELLRKGRFDEIFYVGLPNSSEREKILQIHIGKRRKADLVNVDLTSIVEMTDGYSGADIEGVIKEAVERAFVHDMPNLTKDIILQTIKDTVPITVIMKEQIEEMENEYKDKHFRNATC